MVNSQRGYDGDEMSDHARTHLLGLNLLRVAAAVRDSLGNEGVARLYTALGTAIHVEKRRNALHDPEEVSNLLDAAGFDRHFAEALDDSSRDQVIKNETDLALTRAGRDIGTPVITFAPPDGPSFFGPVISRIPRGEEALALWDATERLARFPGFAELKRSVRESPQVN